MTDDAPETRIYDVELSTLLGKRGGSLGVSILEGRLFGLLSLMKAENPVQGVVDAEGRCRLSGSIRTRMSAYPFEGEGLLLPESVELMLRCAGSRCLCAEQEGRNDHADVLSRDDALSENRCADFYPADGSLRAD